MLISSDIVQTTMRLQFRYANVNCRVATLAALRDQTCSAQVPLEKSADDRIVRCGIISSCQSAATYEIVKALICMRHSVSSAVSSTYGPLPFKK